MRHKQNLAPCPLSFAPAFTPPMIIPRHVAIIMDGNGRWARARFLPRLAGHRQGARTVRKVLRHCTSRGVQVLTLFAFSSENWRRPPDEVEGLMELFMSSLEREVPALNESNVQLFFIGDRDAFSGPLRERISEAERTTADNDGLQLVIAAGYGGRWDIAQAARRVVEDVTTGRLDPAGVDEQAIAARLSTCAFPDPELLIRTGGERRVSNFLLWQCAYTELYFTDVLWPDFDEAEFDRALAFYAARERRFGRVTDTGKEAGA